MRYFLAINNKQLGICLRMLFADGIQGNVETLLNGKHKIEFHITANVDDQTFDTLIKRYNILIA